LGTLNDHRASVADIEFSDPTRDFTSVEWNKLRDAGYTSTLKLKRRNANDGRGTRTPEISSLRAANSTLDVRLAAMEGNEC